jgi:NAD(P)H-dependent FMN reductase
MASWLPPLSTTVSFLPCSRTLWIGHRVGIAFNGKVAGVMSASPGALAGLRGQSLLRAQLAYLGMVVVPDRVGVGRAHEAFDESGAMKDSAQQRLLEELGEKTARFVQRLLL